MNDRGEGTAVHDEILDDALFQLVHLDVPRYRQADVAALSGVPHERSVTWWRAMGFPEVPPDAVAFGDLDVEMVRRLGALTGAGLAEDESVHRLARLLGSTFSRVAEAQAAILDDLLADLPGADPDVSPKVRLDALIAQAHPSVVDLFEQSLVYVWRRHFLAALGRRLHADDPAATEGAVGFADLSGFTRLSQRLDPDRLADLIDLFEMVSFDVVSLHGGRTIKLIGDEVMFAAPTLGDAVDIGIELAERLREVPDMPEIHCGIAFGPVVTVGGDVFGPTANLAARLTTIARRGTIVIPRDVADQLDDREDLEVVPVRRPFHLKGIGGARIVAVRRTSA